MDKESFFSLAKRSFPFCFGGIWLFCGAPFLIIGIYLGINTFQLQERFEREAMVADGMVLMKSVRGKKDSKSYWVGYRFRAADGTVVQNEVQVDADSWDRLMERGTVPVMYLPDHPEMNRIEGTGTNWTLALIFTGVGLFFVPIGGWIFFKGLRQVMGELKLRSERTTAVATIVDVGPADVSFNGIPQWKIRYRYHDYRGKSHIGESVLMSPEEAKQWTVGDKGSVRFESEAPEKSAWIGKA